MLCILAAQSPRRYARYQLPVASSLETFRQEIVIKLVLLDRHQSLLEVVIDVFSNGLGHGAYITI